MIPGLYRITSHASLFIYVYLVYKTCHVLFVITSITDTVLLIRCLLSKMTLI